MNRKLVELAAFALLCVALFVLIIQLRAFDWLLAFLNTQNGAHRDQVLNLVLAVSLILPALLFVHHRSLKRASAEKLHLEEQAREAARHDPLTGLHNRQFLLEKLTTMVGGVQKNGSPVPALLLLDIDRFKSINDLHGHKVGDLVLRQVAERISDICGSDQLPIRFGGDAFAVVFEDSTDGENALGLARRITQSVAETGGIAGHDIAISCSCGIVVWAGQTSAAALVIDAEHAMDRAKLKRSGDYAVFNHEMGEALRMQASTELDLRLGIGRQEIQPYFQPILDLKGKDLAGFEVLARWHCPKRGIMMPDKFIGIAEDCGLIAQLTWDLMTRACEVALNWAKPLSISFNISPLQFRDSQFVDRVAELLKAANFPADRVVLEITESALIEDVTAAHEIFKGLSDLGVRLSLDDFGTGYSSLAMLNEFRFDNVKIDRSFVTGLTEGSQRAKIVDGILALANSLDLSVTAEGIENLSELDFLGERHCPNGQGFLIAKPLSVADLDVFLESWNIGGGDSALRAGPRAS